MHSVSYTMCCADAKVRQACSRIHILSEKVKQAEYCPSTGVRVIQGVSWAEAKWFKKKKEGDTESSYEHCGDSDTEAAASELC